MKKPFLLFFAICGLLSPVAQARTKQATLPGGLLFPQFAAAAFTNAAALTSDWYTEVQGLYSPSTFDPTSNSSSPHSYLFGYAASNPKIGFNVGYLGSTQSGIAIHNIFSGFSFRRKAHSFGIAVRKNDLAYSTSIPVDLSWIWSLSYRARLGLVGYDLLQDRIAAIGIGYEKPSYYSLEADVQFPFPGYPDVATHEYTANFASVVYFENLGFSLGTRYQKWTTSDSDLSKWRTSVGTFFKIKKRFSVVALYTSNPASYTVGFSWGNPPTAQQWIEHWLKRDREMFGS